ncbi:MAG TPA: LytR C-terminal domain-containing protein [Rhodothermales bacterium]|nr:LytR C-terminal domain-containing protein [Rhodothermales bacterium]
MASQRTGLGTVLFNLMLVVLGLVVVVLLYAFVSSSFTSTPDPTRDANPGDLVGDIIQVEVRNGCGVTGLAAEMTQFLRGEGFDVVEVGDYTSFNEPKTLVIDRVGNLEAARQVAASLGLPEDRVIQDIRQDYFLDASVVIGQDYATIPPFAGD